MKKLLLITLTIVVTLVSIGYAQVVHVDAASNLGGKPYSFSGQLKTDAPDPVIMPGINMSKLQMEDEVNDAPGKPYRFASGFDVNLNLNNSGSWEDLPDGSRVWRLKVACPDALSINFLYDDFYMPPGAAFFIYTPSRKQVLGPFGEFNNKADRMFATALLYGDEAILEYYEPAKVRGKGSISIFKVNHGYRGYGENNAHLGNSGNCQVNVNCSPEGDNWQTIKKSVGKYTVNGNAWCSGALINTTANDCRAYFLTADHCAEPIGLDAINSPTTGNTLVFYWNFERPGCDDTGTPPQETTVGASILANPFVQGVFSNSSDFALFQLTEDPSIYDVYFAGWDASGTTGTGGVGIHHPAGDAKKIATHSMTPTSVVSDRYWRIYWDQTANGWSVTEGGSSGSPLFNSNGIIIGQLFGGFLGGQPNCSDPADDEADYGKLSYSWTNNGATDARRRLNTWLDPIGNGTITSVGGRAPCRPINDICSDATELSCGNSTSGNTDGATDSDAPVGCVGGGTPDEGVWFTFIGDGQIATVNTTGSAFDTQINIYEGSCGNLVCIGGNDDIDSNNLASSFTFCTQNGVTYYIYLDGFGNLTGDYQVSLSCSPDTQAPSITCPGNISVNVDPGLCSAVVMYNTPEGTDNCPGASTIRTEGLASGAAYPVGVTTITHRVSDVAGNVAFCSFTVTVTDNILPDVQCSNQTLIFNGEMSIPLDESDLVEATDNCGVQNINLSPSSISSSQVGQTVPVAVTVTDVNGNSETCTSQITVDGLPSGWSQNPNGIGCLEGNNIDYNASNATWTANSTNCYYTPPFTSDATAFAQYSLCGDGSITAQVTGISGTALGWAGVTMRETNAPGAKKAQLTTNMSNFSRREFRTTTNGAAFPQQFPSLNRRWLRIVRSGNQFAMYVSPNGINWAFTGAQTIQMNNCIEIGLVVTNYTSNSTVTATFANVSVIESNQPLMANSGDLASFDFVEDRQRLREVKVFPNPTAGQLNIALNGYEGRPVTLEVYNTVGQILYTRKVDEVLNSDEIIDLSSVPGGMYLIRVSSDGLPAEMKRVTVAR